MSLSTPTSTDAHYDPHNHSAPDSHSDSGKNADAKYSAKKKFPAMRQEMLTADQERSSAARMANAPSDGPSSGDHVDDIWGQLDKLKIRAQQRKENDEARKKTLPNALPGSEPSYRTPSSSAKNQQASSTLSVNRGFSLAAERQGGVDPVLFEKLGEVKSGKILIQQLVDNTPKPIPVSGPCISGEWTVLHVEAACNLELMPALIASGASVDAQEWRGRTLLHVAFGAKDAKAANQLLVAGANPLIADKNGISPLFCALGRWPEMAQAMAEAVLAGAKANAERSLGFTETHVAVSRPEILYILLSKGLQDQECRQGETALMLASSGGTQLSVKYLLGHRPADEPASAFSRYLESRSKKTGRTALGEACVNNDLDIAELLLRHGASLDTPPGEPSLLKRAIDQGHTKLVKILLKHGAADFEPDVAALLFTLAQRGQSEAVSALGRHVSLKHKQQHQLLTKWMESRDCETLAAISPLIPPTVPNVKTMMKSRSFLKIAFTEDSPELLVAMLEFFERRDSFHCVIQSHISHLIDHQLATKNPDMGRALLEFARPRFARLCSDRETVMRLLQLSEQLKDYSLVTEIKAKNFSGNSLSSQKLPFHPAWISDPVSLEFLGVKDGQDAGKLSDFVKTVKSWIATSNDHPVIDGAQLSNDLILALKADSVGKALAETFEAHRISAVIRQALLPLLEKLVAGLYPDQKDRRESVSRLLIGYTLSNLDRNPLFTEHPSIALMKSDPHWDSMKHKVDADIETIEQVAETILETMVSAQLGPDLPAVVARLTLQTQDDAMQRIALENAFRSTLGLLDFPARRLAQACVHAAQALKKSSTSSTSQSATKKLQTPMAQLTPLITLQLQAMEKQPLLDEQLRKDLQALDVRVIDSYQDIVWWQMDRVFEAFGVDDSDSRSQQENEKS